jgi:hypothetical protein
MRHYRSGLTVAGVAVLLLAACGGGGGGSGSSSSGGANQPPTANAGAAQTVTSGTTVTLNGSGTDTDGSISSYAWSQTVGGAVTLSGTTVAQPTFTAPTVASATTLTFSLVVTDNRGTASSASTVNVTVNPPGAGTVNVTGRVRYARPLFSTTSPFGLNYAAPELQPSRGVMVRALNAATQAELASGFTNATGDYTLAVPANVNIQISVVARLGREPTAPLPPRWDVRVQDGVNGTPYSHVSATFNSSAGTPRNIDIPLGIDAAGQATGTRASGPFAALDTIYEAMQLILEVEPQADFPALIVDWGTQNSGTFFDGGTPQRIALLSNLASDTDEFDAHVVAHEFGHYIENNFSRADNIGGPHGVGDKLDIRVAFGEGFGYAFAAMVLDDPNARDSFVNNGTLRSGGFNIEDNPPAANDPTGCWCSESSVWSVLYDLYDGGSESGDAVALGFGPLWDVLTDEQRITPAFTSIFSFITALRAEQAGVAAAIDSLVSVQNIVTSGMTAFGTTENNQPSGVASAATFPLYTTATIGGPSVVLRTANDAGTINKLGNHRYVRFDVASPRNVTITLTTSNPSANADPDFMLWRAGALVRLGIDGPPGPETETNINLSAGTYVLDLYDCANGCNPTEPEDGAGSGDYDLTLTIN